MLKYFPIPFPLQTIHKLGTNQLLSRNLNRKINNSSNKNKNIIPNPKLLLPNNSSNNSLLIDPHKMTLIQRK
jgi:hypothetical protein